MPGKFTFTQKIYIDTIEKFKKEHPNEKLTTQKIAELVGVKSKASVYDMLQRLEGRGYYYKD